MKYSVGTYNFLEEISCLSDSIVFLYLFALIIQEGFLISPCYSLELCIQMEIYLFFSFAFHLSFFSQLFVRSLQTTILLFHISFSWGWSCAFLLYNVMNIIHSSSDTLSIRSSPLNLFLTSTV